MRGRLGRFIPIVMLAVLVQIFAPIAVTWASVAANDPISSAPICAPGSHNPGSSHDENAADCIARCSLCVLAHAATPLLEPMAPFVALQLSYQRVVWLADFTPVFETGKTSRPPSQGPPFLI